MRARAHVADHYHHSQLFKRRAIAAALICLLMIGGLLLRLAWLQVIDGERLQAKARWHSRWPRLPSASLKSEDFLRGDLRIS